jgi:hypothetical protein
MITLNGMPYPVGLEYGAFYELVLGLHETLTTGGESRLPVHSDEADCPINPRWTEEQGYSGI